MRRSITFVLASLAMSGGLLATSVSASAGPTSAAPSGAADQRVEAWGGSAAAAPCWSNGGWYCNNRAPVTIYKGPVQDRVPAGTVTTTTSWVLCRAEGTPTGGGGPHPNRWIRTQADQPAGAWGWMKDSDISSETNSLPVC